MFTTVMIILNYCKSVFTLLNCNVIVTKHLSLHHHAPTLAAFSSSVVGVTIEINVRIERIEAASSGVEEDEGLYATYAMLHMHLSQ